MFSFSVKGGVFYINLSSWQAVFTNFFLPRSASQTAAALPRQGVRIIEIKLSNASTFSKFLKLTFYRFKRLLGALPKERAL